MSLHSVDRRCNYDVIAFSSVCSTEKGRVEISLYGGLILQGETGKWVIFVGHHVVHSSSPSSSFPPSSSPALSFPSCYPFLLTWEVGGREGGRGGSEGGRKGREEEREGGREG